MPATTSTMQSPAPAVAPAKEKQPHWINRHHRAFFALAILIGIVAAIVLSLMWYETVTAVEKSGNVTTVTHPNINAFIISSTSTPRTKAALQTVKGLYLTAYSANSTKKLDSIIDLIDTTELNAVVIDIKDYSGLVLYNSKLPLVNQLKLKDNRYTDLAATIAKLHQHHIYVIGRQTVFQDPELAVAKPEWAIDRKEGGVWKDGKGLSWVDPTKKPVWQYELNIAKEASQYGFDEINFDYVRFPSDGDMSDVAYSNTGPKYEVMNGFYSYVQDQMKDIPVRTSFDMFGLVMDSRGTNDLGIGQRLADAMGKVDYIDPMMYPSHYAAGYDGFSNPAAHPGEVITNGMIKGLPAFASSTTEVRPWIQDFNIGAVYDGPMIRQQIDAVEKYTNAGWLLWNAENRYSDAGLKAQ